MSPEIGSRLSDRTRWNLVENRLSEVLRDMRAAGTPLIDLTQSNPTECGFVYDRGKIQTALTSPEIFRYQPDPRGLRLARDAVAKYYQEHGSAPYGGACATVSSEDLILTAGTSEAYSFVFRLLCNAGDEVLVPAPGYPLFEFLADLCDVRLVRYPLAYDHGWQIDFRALAAAATERTKAVIVVHPNNPTGHFAAPAERAMLGQFCAANGLALIADEVFLDFAHPQTNPFSFAGNGEVLTFVLSGISKICGLPQMKLAWIAVSGPAESKMESLARLEVIADSYLSVGTPVQVAVANVLAMRSEFQSQVKRRLRANLLELDRQLKLQEACGRLVCDGGWTAVLRVPALQSDEDLAIALLRERNVAIHPGHFYEFAQPGHLVVSLIVPEPDFARGIGGVLAQCS